MAAENAVLAPPTPTEKPLNRANRSWSIFLAIASPNKRPISATTLLADEARTRSVIMVRIATVETVRVTPSVETAVLSTSLPSVSAAADCTG